MENKSLSFTRRLVRSEVLTILMAGGYLGSVLDFSNRVDLIFSWRDTWTLLAVLAATGLLAAAGLHGLARLTRGRSDRWLSPAFYFLMVLVAFNFFPALRWSLAHDWPWLSGTVYYLLIWGLGLLLTLAAVRWNPMQRLASIGWRGVGMLWPILLIIPFSLLTARKWESSIGNPLRLDPPRPARVLLSSSSCWT